jgi:hypothetical protein
MVCLLIAHLTVYVNLSAETERGTSGATTFFVPTFHKECARCRRTVGQIYSILGKVTAVLRILAIILTFS